MLDLPSAHEEIEMRMTVSQTEEDLVRRARELDKLRGKRRDLVDKLTALDSQIAGVTSVIQKLIGSDIPEPVNG